MIASDAAVRPDELARQLFSVATHFCLALPRGRRRAGDLKDVEFLTLTLLSSHGTMIVGDIQRLLGVLPAQMSRIIRSLEARDRPLIACRINPQDKRKIDVCLTSAGEKALAEYREQRVRAIAELLSKLRVDDLEDVHGLLGKLHLLPERLAPVVS
ncbi:MAG TPA: MarR family transcriptional regulator [Gemmataceae bacterium]|nr:MarR family transcriptional regulator [Gemmataceae bacterium]